MEIGIGLGAVLLALRFVTGLFSKRGQVYRPNFTRQLYLLFWPLLCLAVGLPFLASFFLMDSLSTFELVLLVALAAVILGFSVPALVLHMQYYLRNQPTTLVFEPKQNVLEVYENGARLAFSRQDIVRVERVTCASKRMFWSNYDFIRLHFRQGPPITLTSLLLNLEPVAEFLRNTNLEKRTRWICFA
ncbi:hypothetical protein [Hymenobacter sp. DG25A]|uniref:hypothetical protein n=1 Tax=Hymenobacter sp. DG25A TaxID=1385663 RepID=UPI0006BC59EF|nr:hypothetical protein [Hymenobacter sp. DG25A]ALD21886.1 hypothetical protein AM218_12570 [Hymenobacter sp. DG25A]